MTSDVRQLDPMQAARLIRGGGVVATLGMIWAVAAAIADTDRFAHAYLVGFLLVASLPLGALFFVLIQHVTRAGWSVAPRRQAEWMAGGMLLVAALFLPLVAWGPIVWSGWMAPHAPLEHGKAVFLNPAFFYARSALYLGLWALLARFFVRRSMAQDVTGEPRLTLRMEAMSAPALVLFGLSVTLASFDWLMSLDPHWYSTIFGVYFFSGAVVAALAVMVLITLALQRSGALPRLLTIEHRHELGKLLFAFTVFYAYIAFCQYFLIWYANIPEETVFYLERWEGSWQVGSLLLIALRFALPFLLLLSRAGKRFGPTLALAALAALAGHYIDLYWVVMPKSDPGHFGVTWVDLGALAGPLGLFLLWVVVQVGRGALYPIRDPRLHEALHFENG